MLSLAVNTYIHILFIIVIIVCLVVERLMIKPQITWESLLKLMKVDGLYGFAAIVVVTTGLLNWFSFGKGDAYYSSNVVFLIKLSLFIVIGILSIYPTVAFFKLKKKHKSNPPEQVSIENANQIKSVIQLELVIMAVIPLLATLMANGIGFW